LAGNVVLPVAQDISRWFRREVPNAAAFERMLFEVIGLALARTSVAARVNTALADQGFRTWLLTASAAAELALPPAPVPLAPGGDARASAAVAAGGGTEAAFGEQAFAAQVLGDDMPQAGDDPYTDTSAA